MKRRKASEKTFPIIIFGDENMPGKDSSHESQNESPKNLTALLVKPEMYPQKITLKNDFAAMKKAVAAEHLEFTPPFAGDSVVLITGERTKIDGSTANRSIKNGGKIVDVICGNFLLVGDDINSGDFCSLTSEQLKNYETMFSLPRFSLIVTNNL